MASLALAGHEGLPLELRVRTCLELNHALDQYRLMYPSFNRFTHDVKKDDTPHQEGSLVNGLAYNGI